MKRKMGKAARLAAAMAIAWLGAGCDSGTGGNSGSIFSTCVPGQSDPCTCTDGSTGAQVCQPDRTYGACSCENAVPADALDDADGSTPDGDGVTPDGHTPGPDATPECVPGLVIACTCPGGTAGAQACQADGFFGPCFCGDEPDVVVTPDGQPLSDIPDPDVPIGPETGTFDSADDEDDVDVPWITGPPITLVTPSVVDFGNVGQGTTGSEPVTITNLGTGLLRVTSFRLVDEQGSFALVRGANVWQASMATANGITFEPPIEVEPGGSTVLEVRFTPTAPQAATGLLRFFSNDPARPEGTQVILKANVGGPCIAVSPSSANFGGQLIGKLAKVPVEIRSCGDAPLVIESLRLRNVADASEDFSLDLSDIPGAPPGAGELRPEDPDVILAPNESATFDVLYVPDAVNPVGPGGLPVPDLGWIDIQSNTFFETHTVDVSGFGVLVECPTAVIKVAEGEEVIPQTLLHLTGSQSYAAAGSISKYLWSVDQPPNSQSVFLPSASAPDPKFEANVAGTYVFRLKVWDQNDVQSCVAAEYTVIVRPDESIHIELLWTTPQDGDETDEGPEAGADLDLHFVHPFATGGDLDGDGQPDGWFDNPFDCFWFNPSPDWASLDPFVDDDPGLDRDDTDGAGPENVNLNIPEHGLTYTIGVHYWNDHGWGKSYATVRVYIHSILVFETTGVELQQHDMWTVATVSWPDGLVIPVYGPGGDHKIAHNYEHPLFGGD